MLNQLSGGTEKDLITNTDIQSISRNVAGDVLDIQTVESGTICTVRASGYLKSALRKNQTYRLNNIVGFKPIYSVISYYPQSTGKPFMLQITTEGDINITPQVDFNSGDSINFNETFIRSSIGGGLLSRVIQRMRTLGKKVCVC